MKALIGQGLQKFQKSLKKLIFFFIKRFSIRASAKYINKIKNSVSKLSNGQSLFHDVIEIKKLNSSKVSVTKMQRMLQCLFSQQDYKKFWLKLFCISYQILKKNLVNLTFESQVVMLFQKFLKFFLLLLKRWIPIGPVT